MKNPKNLPNPRKPNREELEQLTRWYRQQFSQEESDTAIEMAYIAVFDEYQTFYPGFVGKVMVVVWGTAPSDYQVFHWGNKLASERITPLNQQADSHISGADRWD